MNKNKTGTWSILGFNIRNTGNSDGYVLMHPLADQDFSKYGWLCNLGNYGSLESARRDALIYFMIINADKFGHHIRNLIVSGNGCHHEWFLLRDVLKKQELEMPEEVSHSDDTNFSILWNDKQLATTKALAK